MADAKDLILIDNVYSFTDKATGLVVDANSSGSAYTHSWNGGGYQKWQARERRVEGNGWPTYAFIQVETGRALDSNDAGSVYTNPFNGGNYQRWYVKPGPPGLPYVYLENLATGRVLDSNRDGNIYAISANGGDYQAWLPALPDIAFTYSTLQMRFSDPEEKEKYPVTFNKTTINNDSGGTITQRYQYEQRQATTFEWGLTESLGVSATVGAEVGIPGMAASTSVSVNVDISSHQTWTTTQEVAYVFEETIEVPPHTEMEVESVLEIAQAITIPFSLLVSITAVDRGGAVSGQDIAAILKSQGSTATTVEVEERRVVVHLPGTLRSSFGVNKRIEAHVIRDLKMQEA